MNGHPSANPPAVAPAWVLALSTAIATDPRGKAGVAERLGVTRAYVSRVVCGDLAATPPERFVARVQAVLMQVQCPYLARLLPPDQCRSYAQRSYSQVNQFEVDHWRACRRCPNKAPPALPAPLPAQAQQAAPKAPPAQPRSPRKRSPNTQNVSRSPLQPLQPLHPLQPTEAV